MGKIKTIIWYLERPWLYRMATRDFFERYILRKSPFDMVNVHGLEEVRMWCKRYAVDVKEAIQILTGKPLIQKVRDVHNNEFSYADQVNQRCTIELGGPGNVELLYWLARDCSASKVIETGVAFGWSSLALLCGIQDNPKNQLISTNIPYMVGYKDEYVGGAVPNTLRAHWKIISRPDRQSIPKAIRELKEIDLCHYDSDKTYKGRCWAYPVLWQALRPGGYFISDDIEDNFAFREFVEKLGLKPIIVSSPEYRNDDYYVKYVGVIKKPIG
jgi:predicted O-methyltransferase YrrM